MLMAAGLGTRLRPFTTLEPKALLPVMGIPTAQFAVSALVKAGVQSIVANVHHQAERTKAGLLALDRGKAALKISDESALLLGSAGGIAKALPHFGDKPFFWVNADVLCDVDLHKLAQRHLRLREQYGVKMTMTVFPKPKGKGAYREIQLEPNAFLSASDGGSDFGLVQGIPEEAVTGRPYFVSVGIIEPEALAGISPDEPAELLTRVFRPLIAEKKMGYYLTDGQWYDVGSPQLWLETHEALIQGLETGALPREWRLEIEKKNKRIAQEVWISKGSKRDFVTSSWVAPAYFNHLGDSTAQPPSKFGPDAVLYGDAHSFPSEFARRIGYRGLVEKI
jgi:MurNAc alpha-1-phosphate uridylyltransferase